MGRIAKIVGGLFLTASLLSVSASAYEVQPMRHSLLPSQGKLSSLITVKNTRTTPLPVEPIFQARAYDQEGGFDVVDASADFLIFPPQALIPPGETQSFRFQYVGDADLEQERAYTLLVKEVPVDIEESFTGLRYLYDFGVAVYLEDDSFESRLSVSDVTRQGDVLKFLLTNESPSFGLFYNDAIRLSQEGKQITLDGAELTGLASHSVVAPNSSLMMSLDISSLDIGPGDISVRLDERSD